MIREFITRNRQALTVSGIYLLVGAAWILVSDVLLLRVFFSDLQMAAEISRYQTVKGWFFITATAVMLFLLVRAVADRLRVSRESLRRQEIELERLAHYDALTGLPNRLLFSYRLERAIANAGGRRKIALLYLNLSDFKSVNEGMGHAAGDDLLRECARRFRQVLRHSDSLARPDGDEFLILQEDIGSEGEAASLAMRLLDSLDRPFTIQAHALYMRAFIGISLHPDNARDAGTLLRLAHTALQRARQDGRERYRFFSEEMADSAGRQLRLVSGLREALERGDIHVHYQPIVDLRSGRITSAEALARWEDPQLGSLFPSEFIPAAEHSGLIAQLGKRMLEEVTRHLREWQDSGVELVPVTVNISVRQFRDQNLFALISGALKARGLDGKWLGLEITESIVMEDPEEVLSILERLRSLGIGLYLDDFGTGFSSFAHLARLNLDVLKIDGSFIANIDRSPRDRRIVAAMIEIAENLEMESVAEGVESREQLAFLREHGCRRMQGFLFSPALPAEDFARMLREGKTLT